MDQKEIEHGKLSLRYSSKIFGWKRQEMIKMLIEMESQREERKIFAEYLENKKRFDEQNKVAE